MALDSVQIFNWRDICLKRTILSWISLNTINDSLKDEIQKYLCNTRNNYLDEKLSHLLIKELLSVPSSNTLHIILAKQHEITPKVFYNYKTKGFTKHFLDLSDCLKKYNRITNNKNSICLQLEKRMKKINNLMCTSTNHMEVLKTLKFGHSIVHKIIKERKPYKNTYQHLRIASNWFRKCIYLNKKGSKTGFIRDLWKKLCSEMGWNMRPPSIVDKGSVLGQYKK